MEFHLLLQRNLFQKIQKWPKKSKKVDFIIVTYAFQNWGLSSFMLATPHCSSSKVSRKDFGQNYPTPRAVAASQQSSNKPVPNRFSNKAQQTSTLVQKPRRKSLAYYLPLDVVANGSLKAGQRKISKQIFDGENHVEESVFLEKENRDILANYISAISNNTVHPPKPKASPRQPPSSPFSSKCTLQQVSDSRRWR